MYDRYRLSKYSIELRYLRRLAREHTKTYYFIQNLVAISALSCVSAGCML